ncbi:integrase [Catenulispora sp. GAS73]|uniref:tyrosine-type recombinase/integrase n=1 Tax=Catenulispora sp. GAS73 TaxID=3156269 RepID=UPI00351129E5
MAYPEKRGNNWRVRFKRPDGTYGTDPEKYPTKTAAKNRCEEIEAAQRAGNFVDPTLGRITLDEYVERWFARMHFRTHNEQTKRSAYKCHIQPTFGSVAVADIQRPAVQEWVTMMVARIAAGDFKTRTLEATYGVLKEIMTDAEANDYIPKTPCRSIKRPANRPSEKVFATGYQIVRIGQRLDPWNEMPTIIAGTLGTRYGETMGALRESFDRDAMRLYGHNRLEPGTMRDGEPLKGMSANRPMVLPPYLVELIDAWLEMHDSKYICPSQRGKILRPKAFYADWDPIVDQICPGLTFHGLRHSVKVAMDEAGIPDPLKRRQFGHSGNGVPAIYEHVTEAMERRLRNALQHRWEQAGGDTAAIIKRWKNLPFPRQADSRG